MSKTTESKHKTEVARDLDSIGQQIVEVVEADELFPNSMSEAVEYIRYRHSND